MTKPSVIVIASSNAGKLRELRQILSTLGAEIEAQSEFNTPEVAETGLSFVENAIIKARQACKYSGFPAIADDSGIEVDALGGQPGVFSARFAGENASDDDNNAKLLDLLREVPEEQRTVRYRCSMVYMRHAEDPSPLVVDGSWEGRFILTPRGTEGFGYDPYFFLPTQGITAAELSATEKNTCSHRAIASEKLLKKLSLL